MAEMFKLPGSSYDEIVKIIKAYSGTKEGTVQTLDDVAQSTGMDRTIVSANNGFLVQVGIITEGNKKSTTDSGRMLGRAYNSKIDDEITRLWKSILFEDEFINRMITAVRVREGMDKAGFINHIIYSSGQKETSRNKAGAGALVEILKAAEIVYENDGKILINEDTVDKKISNPVSTTTDSLPVRANAVYVETIEKNNSAFVLNINLNISCNANEIGEVSSKLKMLIKEMSEE
jgi:hypothetical protein